ncbi:VOC family protein [Rhodovulum sulfidophilum]|uniref:VOC family protein n=1 Tax=Rhodovulum sulfidophilum TaxID=35806 RepID=UPI001389597F|nr:VOC family protein [Rhodovulum sulfidophilum]NDK36161.1 VOC family protein [Rhodovulum sulfidophilum]
MSHRTRIGGLCIDCRTEDPGPALAFRSAAPGREGALVEDVRSARPSGPPAAPQVILQAVGHDPRVPLDIEAECVRPTGLGAVEVTRVRDRVVRQAPSGHRFCPVPPEGEFPKDAMEVD